MTDRLVRPYSQITPLEIEWVIPGLVPRGELTVLAGLPGLGKSLLTCRWAADLSRKHLSTLLVSIEDSPSHTIWWRLAAAEAEFGYVFDPLVYPMFDGNGSTASFERILDDVDPAPELVILDPFTGMMDAKTSSWSDQHVRLILAPLANLASERNIALVYLLHLNKTQSSDPLSRIGGSGGLVAGPRSVCLFSQDPQDPEGVRSPVRLLAHIKCNVAELAPTQEWRLEPIVIPNAPKRDVRTARLTYVGTSTHDGAYLLGSRPDAVETTERDEAQEIILSMLSSGECLSTDLEKAVRECGISLRTYDRARRELGIRAYQRGRKWYSRIVTSQDATRQDATEGWRPDKPLNQAEEFPF
jgi:putative DNA primase/helicase